MANFKAHTATFSLNDYFFGPYVGRNGVEYTEPSVRFDIYGDLLVCTNLSLSQVRELRDHLNKLLDNHLDKVMEEDGA